MTYEVKSIKFLERRNGSSFGPLKVEIIIRRRLLSIILITFVPTILLNTIGHTSNYFKSIYFDTIVSMNVTLMLVLTTMFISIRKSFHIILLLIKGMFHDHMKHFATYQNWVKIKIKIRERLSLGTVPTVKMHPVGTVPTNKMHPVGTVPTDRIHPIGTIPTDKIHPVGTPPKDEMHQIWTLQFNLG